MSVWDEARKLAEKLKSQARSSKIYNKLDQDKSRAGFQVLSPKVRGTLNRPRQAARNYATTPLRDSWAKPVGKIYNYTENLKQNSILGMPMRMGDSMAYAARNPQETFNILKNKAKAVPEFANQLVMAGAQPAWSKKFEKYSNEQITKADLYTKKAIELNKAGKKEEAKKYFELSRKTLDNARSITNDRIDYLAPSAIDDTGNFFKNTANALNTDVGRAGVGTANVAGMLYNPKGALQTMALGGAFSAGLNSIGNNDPRSFVKGIDSASDYAGFVNITNPIIAAFSYKWGNAFKNPEVQRFIVKTIAAVGNVLEDRALSELYREKRTIVDDAMSFGIAYILQKPGTKEDLDYLKDQLKIKNLGNKEAEVVIDTLKQVKSIYTKADDTIKKDIGQWRITTEDGRSGVYRGKDYADWTRFFDSQGIKYNAKYLGTQGGFADFSKAPELPEQDFKLPSKVTEGVDKYGNPYLEAKVDMPKLSGVEKQINDLYVKAEKMYQPRNKSYNPEEATKLINKAIDLAEKNGYEIKYDGASFAGVEKIPPQPPKQDIDLTKEAQKYKSAEEFWQKMGMKNSDALRARGIKGRDAIFDFWNKNVTPAEKIIDNLNPTGGLLVDYDPQSRMTMPLGENITTLDKTMKVSPEKTITIYRGAPKNQKAINPGDFVTTNYELAKSYTGDNNVLSLKVKAKDVLDDITEPLGEEYIYRPLTDIWNKANKPSLKAKVEPSQKAQLKIQPQEPEVKVKSQLDAKTQSPQGELKVASKSEATPEQVLSDTSRNSPETNLAPTDNIPQNLKNGINTNNLELDTQEKAVLENVIENIKPELEEIKGSTLTNAEVKEAAKRSTILQQVTTREQTKQANAAMLAARQRMVELDSEITKAAKEGDTTAVKEKMADLIDSIRVVSSEATDRGRKLQSLSIDAKNTSLREKMLKEITKVSDDTAKIVDEASKVDWDNANQVTKFYRKFITPTLAETIDEFRYNNMLSNPRTHLRNAYSNLFQALITRPATIAAGGDVKGAGKYYVGLVKNIPKAIDDFAKSYKGEDFTKKPDLKRVGTNKLPAIITAPSRAMEASDKFFSALIKGGEAARGTDADEAIKIAEYSLFRQGLKPEGQGKVLNQIDNLTSGIYKMGKQFPALRWFVPFVQTPMNVAKQWIEYSPAGFSTMIGASNQKEQAVKAFLGSAATLMAATLAADGRTTWAAPVDSEEKELFYASGKKPYSVKVGDKWVSMQYFGPFAYAMGLPAAYRYHNDESNTALTDSQIDKIGKTITSMTSLLSGQTFLDGLDNFVQLIRGDADYTLPKNLGYTAGQMIPLQGLVRYISTIVDPVYRKSTGFVDQIKSGIPIMSKSLEGYTTPDGELSKREPQNYFTPFDITTAKLKYEKPQEIRATIRQMDKQRTTISNDVDKLNYDELKEAHPERATYYSAEKIYSEINKLPKDDRAGRAAKLQEFRDRGYSTDEINKAIITISQLEKEGMTKTDRELLLFSPDARAKKIVDRFKGISTKERKQELLKLYTKYGILDEETQKAIIGVSQPDKKTNTSQQAGKYTLSADAPQTTMAKLKTYGASLISNPIETASLAVRGEPIRKMRYSGDNLLEQLFNLGDATTVSERKIGTDKLDAGDKSTQVDHIMPKWLGGREKDSNYQILSNEDHNRKSAFEEEVRKAYEAGDISKDEAKMLVKQFNKTLNE